MRLIMSISNIPQTHRNIDFGKVQYAKRTEEDQVFYDLMARVINVAEPKTLFRPAEILKENDPDFVRKVLVPPFLKLRQKLPQVYYKMLMNKNFFNFHIKIIEYKDEEFKYEGVERRMSAASRINGDDGATIYVNKFDKFAPDLYKEAIYHEIMHIVVGLAVKDTSNKTYTLCDCLNAKYPNQLASLVKTSGERCSEAVKKFVKWSQLAKSLNFKLTDDMVYNKFKAINEECGFWAYRTLAKGENLENYLRENSCWGIMFEEEELLVVALTFFFGSDEEHNRLKKHERWLYDRINNEVRKIINNAPLTMEKACEIIK